MFLRTQYVHSEVAILHLENQYSVSVEKEFLNLYAKLLYKQNRAKEADEIYQKIKNWGQQG